MFVCTTPTRSSRACSVSQQVTWSWLAKMVSNQLDRVRSGFKNSFQLSGVGVVISSQTSILNILQSSRRVCTACSWPSDTHRCVVVVVGCCQSNQTSTQYLKIGTRLSIFKENKQTNAIKYVKGYVYSYLFVLCSESFIAFAKRTFSSRTAVNTIKRKSCRLLFRDIRPTAVEENKAIHL